MNLTDDTGAVTATYSQDAFGNVLSGSTDGFHLTTKRHYPAIGLYYFYQRWYDPVLGRFSTKSPMPSFREHPYLYCENNPLNNIDPSGLAKITNKICKYACYGSLGVGGSAAVGIICGGGSVLAGPLAPFVGALCGCAGGLTLGQLLDICLETCDAYYPPEEEKEKCEKKPKPPSSPCHNPSKPKRPPPPNYPSPMPNLPYPPVQQGFNSE